jgi:peptidoglycan hydrolase-like protein with peptidoglycan-binding domain
MEFRSKATRQVMVIGYIILGMISLAAPVLAQPRSGTVTTGTTSTTAIEDSLNIWEKQLVQEGLILLGYYNGFADGVFGHSTRDAISAFQTKDGRSATGQLTAADAVDLGGVALALRKKLDWRPLDTSTGSNMSYPAALLTKRENNTSGGETLDSSDGHVSLMTMRISAADSDGINTLFDKQATSSGDTVTYKLRRPNMFILSGERQGGKYYTRVEQRGDEIRGYDLVWGAAENTIMQSVSVLISNGFHPFNDNSADGQPTYPTLQRLVQQAGQETNKQADGGSPTQSQPSQSGNDTSEQKQGVTEQKTDALPPPKDGSLVTRDGKGLRFVYQYLPPDNPDLRYAYQWAVDTHLFTNIPEIDGLDGMLVTPRPLQYVTAQCGSVNAFYNPKLSAVVLCYEMIDSLTKIGTALGKGASDPKALTIEFVRDNIRFILLHESGHAMIDMLDLPAVGREEDSVDQLAAVLLLSHVETSESQNDIARVMQLAATWFRVNSAGTQSNDQSVYSDEHSLNAQRYFNLLCIVYGRDPDHFSGIVERGMLPKERASRCPEESAKITRSWARLLLPHFSPRFQPHDEPAPGGNENGTTPPSRGQGNGQGGNPLEWDRKSNPFNN